jgi:hypothetical protein
LPPEVRFAIGRLEESPDRSIRIKRQKCSGLPIVAAHGPIRAGQFEDRAANGLISEFLGCSKVVGFGEAFEVAAVLPKVIS